MAPLLAAIPFWEMRMVPDGVRVIFGAWSTVVPTFGIPVDPWATLVCLGVLLGLEVSRARAIRMGLDVADIVDGVVFTVLMGFVGAHLITVVGYYPGRLAGQAAGMDASEAWNWSTTAGKIAEDPTLLVTESIPAILRVWEGFSSTGGFLGGIFGIWWFYTRIRPRDIWRFADLIAYGFPLGWFFGRLGCGVVHDHIGRQTDFFLGMQFPAGYGDVSGIRHELGFYEMLATIPIGVWFWRLGRVDRAPGTFMGWYFLTYAPVRFVLDFLRNDDLGHQDARYLGLTPAQYGVIAMGAFGGWLLWRRDPNFRPWALDGNPDQAARASGVQVVDEAAPAGAVPEPSAGDAG
jgi:phosphatidylglycerol:prolipoprotein diacylglycerol transferase